MRRDESGAWGVRTKRKARHGFDLTTKSQRGGGARAPSLLVGGQLRFHGKQAECNLAPGYVQQFGFESVTGPPRKNPIEFLPSMKFGVRSRRSRASSHGERSLEATRSSGGDIGAPVLASRASSAIALSYLMVTLPLALRVLSVGGGEPSGANASGARTWLILSMHLAIVALLSWAVWRGTERDVRVTRARALTNVFADWLPLIIVSFLYTELPWLMAAYRGGAAVVYHDAWVQAMEWKFFGTQPSHTLAGALPFTWLSEGVHAGYVSYYGIIYLPPLILYIRRRREAFAECSAALLLAFTSCFLVFAFFPVEGPRYAWPAPPGIPDGPVRHAALWVLREGSSRGAAFPSSHAAVSVAQTLSLWLAGERRMSIVVGTFTALLVVGAVYGGFHYAVDMAVGVAVGIACGVTGVVLGRRAQ